MPEGLRPTPYNHFSNRGALLDAVLPERLAELERIAQAAVTDPDPWKGFTGFLDGLFSVQTRDRSMNEAIARSAVGTVDVAGECGRGGDVLEMVVRHAKSAGVLRPDFGPDEASGATMVGVDTLPGVQTMRR